MKGRAATLRQVIFLGGLIVLALLIMDFNNRMAELNRLSDQQAVVAVQATAGVQTQVYLQTQIAYATSDQAVEEWARVQAHLIRPGDNPVVPLAPAGGTPAPTPTPEVEVEPVANWQVWVQLFFDEGS